MSETAASPSKELISEVSSCSHVATDGGEITPLNGKEKCSEMNRASEEVEPHYAGKKVLNTLVYFHDSSSHH